MKGELKMKIILSVILSLVFIAASSACVRGTTPSGGTTGSSGDTVSTVGTERPAYRDNLPERDFDGHTFYVLTGVHGAATTHSFYTEETSDALELAFYKRNQAVASRFNLDFYEDDSGNCQKIDTLRTNVSSGDKTVDLYMLWDRFAFSAAQEALVYSIEELEYVDLSNPWWAQKINSRLSFDGKLWFAVGDENPVLMTGCGVLFYNRAMTDNLRLGSFTELVRNGEWTYENFFGAAKTAISDNGDTILDDNDVWGIVTNSNQFYNNLWMTNGNTIIAKDGNDIPYIAADTDSSFNDIFGKIISYAHSEKGTVLDVLANPEVLTKDYSAAADRYEKALHVFGNGNALFAACAVSRAGVLRYFDDLDYGILPFPKAEESKPGTPYDGTIGALVPYIAPSHIDGETAERTGIILEALACAGKNYVNPVYYGTVLAQKEAGGDPDSIEMLDMMFNNRTIDLAEVYFTTDTGFFVICAADNRSYITSLESGKAAIENAIKIAKMMFENQNNKQ